MANVNFYRDTKANIDNVAYTDGQIYFPTDENKILLDTGNARKQYGGDTEIDSALSTTSTNPVQNKVVTTTLNQKLAKTDIVNDLASAVAVTSTTTPVGCGAIKELNSNLSGIDVYVGSDKKLHFVDSTGADSVLPFSNTVTIPFTLTLAQVDAVGATVSTSTTYSNVGKDSIIHFNASNYNSLASLSINGVTQTMSTSAKDFTISEEQAGTDGATVIIRFGFYGNKITYSISGSITFKA